MVYEYHTGNNKIIWKGSNYSPNYRQITMNLSKQTGLLKTAFGKVLMKQFVRSLTQIKDNDVDNKITSVNIFDNIFYIIGAELKKIKRIRICANNSNNKYTRKWRLSLFSFRWGYK